MKGKASQFAFTVTMIVSWDERRLKILISRHLCRHNLKSFMLTISIRVIIFSLIWKNKKKTELLAISKMKNIRESCVSNEGNVTSSE